MAPVDRERDALVATLDARRRHILEVVEGLNERQRRTATLPSGWTPLGLVRHLTLADERYWFDSIVGGAPLGWFPVEPGADWQVTDDESSDEVVAAYARQVEVSNAHLHATSVDAPPRRRDPLWDGWGIDVPDVRWVLHHMVVETATHAGHLDAAVELMDGRQRLVLD